MSIGAVGELQCCPTVARLCEPKTCNYSAARHPIKMLSGAAGSSSKTTNLSPQGLRSELLRVFSGRNSHSLGVHSSLKLQIHFSLKFISTLGPRDTQITLMAGSPSTPNHFQGKRHRLGGHASCMGSRIEALAVAERGEREAPSKSVKDLWNVLSNRL